MKWYVTYIMFFNGKDPQEFVETFAFYPSNADIFDVGEQLKEQVCGESFSAVRGKRHWNGAWIDNFEMEDEI